MIRSHWIKANAASRMPSRWLTLDTEARITYSPSAQTQSWRLAVSCYDHWSTEKGRWVQPEWREHVDPHQLWWYLTSRTSPRGRTVLVAHNLAYDLRISQAFAHLPRLGWELRQFSIGERSSSMVWGSGARTLTMVDSTSWLPTSLERIGGMIKVPKVELPDQTDDDAAWVRRCRTDVEILRAAWLDLLDWIRTDDLGNWQRTGAGQSWATWRHRFYSVKVLVHDDSEARAAEVEATYTGRCEAWQHGRLTGGRFTEWDLPLAYPRICLDTPLPFYLRARWSGGRFNVVEQHKGQRRFLVHAAVDIGAPVLPVRVGDRIIWPTGEATGWWWDRELLLAKEYGATVRADSILVYEGAPFLRRWAEWVIGVAEGTDPSSNPLRALAAKHQARALIGRFASQHQVWQPNGPAIEPGVELHRIIDADSGATGRALTMGGDSWVSWSTTYAENALPAVMSAVMAEARCRLWSLMAEVGPGHLIYVDTDSLITDQRGTEKLQQLIARGGGWGIRPKGHARSIEVLGPRQYWWGSELRAAGLSTSRFIWEGHDFGPATWEGLPAALARGHDDRVIVRQSSWQLAGQDHRRAHLPGGRTAALQLDGDPEPLRAPRIA